VEANARIAGAVYSSVGRRNDLDDRREAGIPDAPKVSGPHHCGGLALAIAIGIGAGWYDFSQDLFRPRIPLPNGDRLVEIEVRDSLAFRPEQRMLFDFAGWRRDARSVERLSAYRTIERTVTRDGVRIESTLVAETTASAFRVGGVAVGNVVIALVLTFTLQRLPIAFITRALMIT
jgi:hypothetical protein